jgi:hypothetical protein
MRMRVLGCWVLVLAAICPQSVSAQVFLAARPKPAFEVGPLLITATVTDAIAPRTPIRIVWGIVPSSGADSGLGEDLYLLWPGQISGTNASPAEPGLVSAVEGPGTRVTASGRLSLSSRSAVTLGSGTRAEAAPSGAPFVSFERKSNTTERFNVGSLIRIPWDPKFGERDRLMILEMNAHKQLRQHRSTWISELFFGRRYDVALSFNNVRVPPLFALYLRQREHVVHLADEVSQLTLSFQQAKSLQLDEITPASAMHRQSEDARSPEIVSLVLNHSDGLAPQILQVRFGYFSGLWAVLPVVFTVGLFALGHLAGPLVRTLARRAWALVAARLHFGRRRGPMEQSTGVILSSEALDRITPGETTYQEVLRLCGPTGELHESRTTPERRRLVYRGRRIVPNRGRTFGWVATVSHWEIEHHEVVVEFDGDHVRDLQADVRRMRGVPGDDGSPGRR